MQGRMEIPMDDSSDVDSLEPGTFDHSDPLGVFNAIGTGQPGGLPMPEIVSPKEVRERAKRMSANIFQNFDLLHSILERHEITIQKRWKKKTQDQRRRILLSAWNRNMSATHRPDFEVFGKQKQSLRESGAQYRDAFMWPYVNQEDLLKPKMLLLFLSARGRYDPANYAASDYEAMHFGIVTKAIVPHFLNNHVMMLRGRTTPSTYGELLNWDDHPDAFTWFNTRRQFQPGEGLLVLEAQDGIMTFLVRCVKEILHEMTEDQLLDIETQSPPSLTEDDSLSTSVAIMAAEAPYRVPSHLSFARIESLLQAKCDEAADHLWSLREDPGYFSHHMRDASDHRQEMLKDTDGQNHPLFRRHREEVFWGRVLGNEISAAYLQLEIWSALRARSTKLRALQERYGEAIKTKDELPSDYMDALLEFQHWLNQCAKGPIGMLKVAFVASPPIRSYFRREPENDPTVTRIVTLQRENVKLDKVQKDLFWLLTTLWEDGQALFLMGITNLLDELQRLLNTHATANQMISSYIANLLSDLSVVCECLRQLQNYQPWANTFEDEMVGRRDDIQKNFARRTEPSARMLNATGDCQTTMAQYGNPNQVRFHYPVDKRKTRENVEAMREAEANLDVFWAKVDETMNRKLGNHLKGTALYALLTQARALQRTPEWAEPRKDENRRGAVQDALCRPLSELYFDLQLRTERTVAPQKLLSNVKAKDKTRGDAKADVSIDSEEMAIAPNAHDQQPVFKVDARALKVFKTLFFTQSVSATPGEVLWTDFLHAMSSTGFRAEKLHGSAWQFSPTQLDVERSIQFHEPHPSSKIPYLVARRFGRRLNRAYGWHGGQFALAEKLNA